MKRYLLTLAVTAALSTPIIADYLVIRINLGAEVTQSGEQNSSGILTGGNGGGGGGGGGSLLGGGGTGLGGGGNKNGRGGGGGSAPLGGGAGGPPPGGGRGGAQLGGGGGGGDMGGGGAQMGGGGGGRPPVGGGGGGRGGAQLGGGGAGGAGGGGGANLGGGGGGGGNNLGGGGALLGGGGQMGGGGGQMGGGMMGGGGGQGNDGGMMRAPGLVTNKGDLFIVATEVDVIKTRSADKMYLKHRWGTTVLNPETTLPDRAVMQVIKVPSLQARYATKRSEYFDSGTKQYMKLADWMLENWNMPAEGRFSMQSTFETYLNELNALAANLSASDKAKLDAMVAVRTQIAKPVTAAKSEQELVNSTLLNKTCKDYKIMQKGHFAIYHAIRDDKQAEAKLNRLENAYAGIMYWFALQGKPLNIPNKQMVCVLADTADKFTAIHKMFDDAPLYSDGFYSPLDNITIFAPTRVDAGFEKFATMATNAEAALKPYSLDFKRLLTDRPDKPVLNTTRDEAQKVTDVVTGQIFAIAKFAAIDEGEAATTTYEAFRQMAASTGYMPRTVILPRSVRDGLGSFFSTPKSSGDHNLPALWSGIGGEHWLHLPLFRKMSEARKSENPEITIDEKLPTRHKVKIGKLDVMAIVSDRVFEKADKASKENQTFLMQKAQAESWALTFYMMRSRPVELKKYYDELAQMPRDMELTPEVLEQAFARAFDLLDATGEKIDTTKVEKFEKDWANNMNYANLTVETGEKAK